MSTISASTTTTTAYKVTADTTGTLVLQTGSTPTTAVTIDTSQNVGIGTSSPLTKFTVGKDTDTDSTNIFTSYRGGSSGQYAQWGNVSSHANTNVVGGGGITWQIAGSEKARINSGGDFLVGTTVIPSASTGNSAALAPTGYQIPLLTSRNTTSAAEQARFYNPNGLVGNIQTTASVTTFNSLSDYRLKDNVLPMVNALSKISALKPCTFKWKIDGLDGQGFIAHELQAVVPDCVTGEKDAVDAEGKPVHQVVDTSFLVATLTAAIQEQQALITQLQADVAALKGQ